MERAIRAAFWAILEARGWAHDGHRIYERPGAPQGLYIHAGQHTVVDAAPGCNAVDVAQRLFNTLAGVDRVAFHFEEGKAYAGHFIYQPGA